MLTIFKQNGTIRMYQVNMKTYFIYEYKNIKLVIFKDT